jgi:asparagine synthase (glutamine-hydrolysing)
MCGIAGFATTKTLDYPGQFLDRMISTLGHRGPDDQGTFKEGSIFLGHRRLSILDLSRAGQQPMISHDGKIVICHNGEVYNYIELRRNFERQGTRFTTETDTEVILEAFRRNGPLAYDSFNGMFAFALYDRPHRRLHLVRDRLGIKPLYYTINEKGLFFASEIKSLLSLPFVVRRSNPHTLGAYLAWGLLDYSEETFYDGIFQVLPGHELLWEIESGHYRTRCYYDLTRKVGYVRFKDNEQYAERFRELFEDSVKLRLRSDVTVGACLSGGLDSSAVVAAALKVWPQKVNRSFNTFTSRFSDRLLDEWEYASEFAKDRVVNMNQIFPTGREFWSKFDELIHVQDGPFTSASVFAQWCLMRKVKEEHVKVLLDGQGGDEALCGYRKFYIVYLRELLRQRSWRAFVEEIFYLLKTRNRVFFNPGNFWRYLPDNLKPKVCNPVSWLSSKMILDKPNFAAAEDVVSRQLLDLKYFSLPSLLHYEDRNSMAFSIEARVPFLDYRLVEYLLSVPTEVKLHHGMTKRILRQALADWIPKKIALRRSKLAFAVPELTWYRKGLRYYFENECRNIPRLVEMGVVARGSWEQMKRSVNGQRPFYDMREVFRFVCAERWMRNFSMV